MKNLNLLFIEGNRTKIDNSNVVESYNKIKAWGFIETMPIEYFPMEEAKNKLGGRKLYRPTITRKKGKALLLSAISRLKWLKYRKQTMTSTTVFVAMVSIEQ